MIAELYVEAQQSFVEFFETLSPDDLSTAVPCTPGWTVRDVLSHVAGVAADITDGNVEGAATEPWTAAQVVRWRDNDPGLLIAQWTAQAPNVGVALEFIGEARPPIDCHSHEHDIRQALGRPGNRRNRIIDWALERAVESGGERAVTVLLDDGSMLSLAGDGTPAVVRGLSRYEFLRSRLGRRSRSQVLAYDWDVPPGDLLDDSWFMFGPSAVDIIE